jgi:hypothetical protein
MVLLAIPVLMKAQTKRIVDYGDVFAVIDTGNVDTTTSIVIKEEVDNIYIEYGTVFITYSASLRTGQAPGFIKLHHSEFNDFASNADLYDYLRQMVGKQYTITYSRGASNDIDSIFYVLGSDTITAVLTNDATRHITGMSGTNKPDEVVVLNNIEVIDTVDVDIVAASTTDTISVTVTNPASPSTVSRYIGPPDFTVTYHAQDTLILTGLPFTLDDDARIKWIHWVDSLHADSRIYISGNGSYTIAETTGDTIVLSGNTADSWDDGDSYTVGIDAELQSYDISLDANKTLSQNPEWAHYTSSEVLYEVSNSDSILLEEVFDIRGYGEFAMQITAATDDSTIIEMNFWATIVPDVNITTIDTTEWVNVTNQLTYSNVTNQLAYQDSTVLTVGTSTPARREYFVIVDWVADYIMVRARINDIDSTNTPGDEDLVNSLNIWIKKED